MKRKLSGGTYSYQGSLKYYHIHFMASNDHTILPSIWKLWVKKRDHLTSKYVVVGLQAVVKSRTFPSACHCSFRWPLRVTSDTNRYVNAPVLVEQGNWFQWRQPGLAHEVNCISHVIRAVIPVISWSCCHLTKASSCLRDLRLDNIVRSS